MGETSSEKSGRDVPFFLVLKSNIRHQHGVGNSVYPSVTAFIKGKKLSLFYSLFNTCL